MKRGATFSTRLSQVLKALAEFKFFLPPDIYERHNFVAQHIKGEGASILDVGGSLGQLGQFTSAHKITTADIKGPADIIYDGKKLSLEDRSFDFITSIDVLEHIEKKARSDFLNELYRVARNTIIISAPIGTKEHLEYEKDILKYYQSKNIKLPYLEEHIKIGLPTPLEINSFIKKYKAKSFYSGDIRITEKFLKMHNLEAKNKYLNLLIFFTKLFFNLFINIFIYPVIVNKKESKYVNRFYLIISKIPSH